MTDSPNAYQALMLKAAQDEAFRDALLKDPKAVLEAHLETRLPAELTVNVVTNTAQELTLVIPPRMSDELSETELDAVAGGGMTPKQKNAIWSLYTFGYGCLVSLALDKKVNCVS